jgi:hypothetical protein
LPWIGATFTAFQILLADSPAVADHEPYRFVQALNWRIEMNAFKAVSGVLLVLLCGWIFYSLASPSMQHPTPQVLDLGSAFEGNLQLPADKIQAAFAAGRDRMLHVNSAGSDLHLAGDIAAWLTFAATSFITLIIGYFGRAPQSNQAQPNTEALPARAVRLIGLLASIAAVMTAFSSLAIAKSQDYFNRADAIRDMIVHDRAQVLDAKDADQAQAVLDDLANKIAR